MNKNVLIIDVGNTNVDLGVVKNGEVLHKDLILLKDFSCETFSKKVESLLDFKVEEAAMSSVAPSINKVIKEVVKNVLGLDLFHCLSKDVPVTLGKNVRCKKEIIGTDILADVIAAKKLTKLPAIVVDLGTVTKYIQINEDGEFIGTSFIPGLQTSIDSMNSKTELLPSMILNEMPKEIFGVDTLSAMKNGIYYSTLGAIEYFYRETKKIFGKEVSCVLTGGYSKLFKESLKDFEIDPNFIIKGIYFLYKEIKGE